MPRKSPVPEREKLVGDRFRQAREAAGFTQAQLARRIGIAANRLTGYEHGRNPVPYWIGARLAEETDTCQQWLATGKGPQFGFVAIDEAVSRAVPKKAWFSEVYDALLNDSIVQLFKERARVKGLAWPSSAVVGELLSDDPPLLGPPIERIRAQLKARWLVIQITGLTLQPAHLRRFIHDLERLAADYRKKGALRADETPADLAERQRKLVVDDLSRKWKAFKSPKK